MYAAVMTSTNRARVDDGVIAEIYDLDDDAECDDVSDDVCVCVKRRRSGIRKWGYAH